MLFFLWDGAEVNVLLAIHTLAVCTSRCSKKNSGTYARAVRSSHASMARLYSYPRKHQLTGLWSVTMGSRETSYNGACRAIRTLV